VGGIAAATVNNSDFQVAGNCRVAGGNPPSLLTTLGSKEYIPSLGVVIAGQNEIKNCVEFRFENKILVMLWRGN